jgi:hypothetical protein
MITCFPGNMEWMLEKTEFEGGQWTELVLYRFSKSSDLIFREDIPLWFINQIIKRILVNTTICYYIKIFAFMIHVSAPNVYHQTRINKTCSQIT